MRSTTSAYARPGDGVRVERPERRLSLSDFLLQQLTEIANQPTLDQVLDRLTSRPRRDLGITAVELLDEARSE